MVSKLREKPKREETKMITVSKQERAGAKHYVTLNGINLDTFKGVCDFIAWDRGELSVEVQCQNKSERQELNYLIDTLNLPAKDENQISDKPSRKRYVELISVAESNGLNHGISWRCNGKTVDANSLNPSWEGEQVCYVYN